MARSDKPVTKTDLQQLSQQREIEARALLDLGHIVGAYYLAGYAVECALKAVIVKRVQMSDSWPPLSFTEKQCFTHILVELAALAGLDVTPESLGMPLFLSWNLAIQWSEPVRYSTTVDPTEARRICTAILDPTEGVLQWIRSHWG